MDQSDGTVLQLYDCWKMKESQQETDCETSFRTLAGISSGPHAFLGFNWDSCLKTPAGEICKSEIDEKDDIPILGIGNCS